MATMNEAEVKSQIGGVGPSRATLSALLSVVFLDNLGYAIVFPYLFFYASSLGASAFIYGVLLSSYSLMSFIFTPLIARLSDRFGRRSILLPALLISGLSYIVFGLADVLWLLFLARMIAGTTAATVPVAQAYVADVTSEKQRLKYLGWTSAAGGLAFIVGQSVGGVLSGFFGFAMPSFLAAGLAFANLFSSYFLLREPACPPVYLEKGSFTVATLRDIFRKSRIALLFVVYFMFFTSFVFMQAVVPPWLQFLFGFDQLQTGYLFAYLGAVIVLTQAFILPWLSKRNDNTTLALYGVALLGAGLLALGGLPFLGVVVVVSALVAVGFGLLITTLSTLISVKAPKEAQGGSLGFAWSLAALAQTVGPTVAASFFTFGLSVGMVGLAFFVSATITLGTVPFIVGFRAFEKGKRLNG